MGVKARKKKKVETVEIKTTKMPAQAEDDHVPNYDPPNGDIKYFMGEYHFLSNFSPHRVVHDGIEYRTAEHAFQAAKTFDRGDRMRIAACPTPGDAKRLGNDPTKTTLRLDWEECRDAVMMEILLMKFTMHADIRRKLIATSPRRLIEGNTWGDTYWGVVNGVGQNRLGRILMEIRNVLAGPAF